MKFLLKMVKNFYRASGKAFAYENASHKYPLNPVLFNLNNSLVKLQPATVRRRRMRHKFDKLF